jgi:2-polyprenyl-6-methoxyphenol hydroxylase-like FAD-dependent oxidoreductase
MSNKLSHAIVIGGSMSGMLAARVLSDHFERVTLIERDHYPASPEFRNGVPQAHHLHVLLVRGMEILEQLFPGIGAELDAAGAERVRWGLDTLSVFSTGVAQKFDAGMVTRACSRVLIDWTVHRRLAGCGKVTFMEQTQGTGWLTTPDHSRITGVTLKGRGASLTRGEDSTLTADLVVDASGRNSPTPEWLQAIGYESPEVNIVNPFLGYATRWYKLPENLPTKVAVVQASPPELKRAGAYMIAENGRMVVTLAGAVKDYPPTDDQGYLEFARSLLSPVIYDAIKDAEPLTPVYGYQRTANQWRHYEKLTRMPDGLIVMGDAACAFNPIYGQGMSVGAMEALALDDLLRRANGDLSGLSLPFQKALARVTGPVWLLATGEDFRYPGTEGKRPGVTMRFTHWYTNRLLELMSSNTDILHAFMKVMNLTQPPTSLFRPSFIWRVFGLALSKVGKGHVPQTQPHPAHSAG